MVDVRIDAGAFWRHLQALCDSWRAARETGDWGSADAIALLHGTAAADPSSSQDGGGGGGDPMRMKGVVALTWLLGYEFTETLALLTDTAAFVLTSAKKAQLLAPLVERRPSGAVRLELLVRGKDLTAQKAQLLDAVRASFGGRRVGVAARDRHAGAFAAKCAELWTTPPCEAADATLGLSGVLAVKDAGEQELARLAAQAAAAVLRQRAVAEIETVVDEERAVTHAKLSETIEGAFEDRRLLGDRIVPEHLEPCYAPVVQSGAGRFNFASDVESTQDRLHHTAMVVRIGARYKLYCANVARTLFVNASPQHQADYRLAVEAHQRLVAALRPGRAIADAVKVLLDYVSSARPDLVPHLPRAFGHGIGIEIKETGLGLTAKNINPIKVGMVFNVVMSLLDVPVASPPSSKKDPQGLDKSFSLMIADTVLVGEDSTVNLTEKCPKRWSDVSYVLGDEEDDEEDEEEKKKKKEKAPTKADAGKRSKKEEEEDDDEDEDEESTSGSGSGEDDDEDDEVDEDRVLQTRLRGREEKPQYLLEAERRKQHQAELARAKMNEAKRRLNGDQAVPEASKPKTGDELANVRSYNSPADMPPDVGLTKIVVDGAHESVILPIFGMMVPFHISTVKNVTARDDTLRINFATPVGVQLPSTITAAGAAIALPANSEDGGIFLREVTYRIVDPKVLGATELQIKEVRKRLTAKLADSRQEKVAPQEQLRIAPGQKPRLTDLSVQPSLTSGKRTTGTLEAHANGFRYTTNRGATLDVMYNNIRYAFFQPSDQELILLLHFHLKSPIVVGKKKTKDVQFYMEVMEVSTALDRQKTHYGDAEEVEEEQREREMRRRHTANFHAFVKKVEEASGLEFDIPYRELGFYGAPGRGNVLLQPTVHALVNLTDTPPFVLCLDDVEIAHFERVSPQHTLRNFDLVFVFKDLTRPVVRINSIPTSESLDAVKNWLDSIDIKYYEGPTNLNWAHILQTIREDFAGFTESGGWSFLEPESESEDDDEVEEGSDFDPEEFEGVEASSSDDDFSADSAASEEEEAAARKRAAEEDEEEESWSELEEEALDADKKKKAKRGRDDDDDDDDDEGRHRKHGKK